MKYMIRNELRKLFLNFFEFNNHLCLPSVSLILDNDFTLLLINAGMAPFKDYFINNNMAPSTRITTSQRRIHTNDIENVGKINRHQTYFEMLGNFSFGDYFKQDAIKYAWEFLTEICELPKEKLWVTIYPDDKESESIWLA